MKYLLVAINFVQVFTVNIAYRVWKILAVLSELSVGVRLKSLNKKASNIMVSFAGLQESIGDLPKEVVISIICILYLCILTLANRRRIKRNYPDIVYFFKQVFFALPIIIIMLINVYVIVTITFMIIPINVNIVLIILLGIQSWVLLCMGYFTCLFHIYKQAYRFKETNKMFKWIYNILTWFIKTLDKNKILDKIFKIVFFQFNNENKKLTEALSIFSGLSLCCMFLQARIIRHLGGDNFDKFLENELVVTVTLFLICVFGVFYRIFINTCFNVITFVFMYHPKIYFHIIHSNRFVHQPKINLDLKTKQWFIFGWLSRYLVLYGFILSMLGYTIIMIRYNRKRALELFRVRAYKRQEETAKRLLEKLDSIEKREQEIFNKNCLIKLIRKSELNSELNSLNLEKRDIVDDYCCSVGQMYPELYPSWLSNRQREIWDDLKNEWDEYRVQTRSRIKAYQDWLKKEKNVIIQDKLRIASTEKAIRAWEAELNPKDAESIFKDFPEELEFFRKSYPKRLEDLKNKYLREAGLDHEGNPIDPNMIEDLELESVIIEIKVFFEIGLMIYGIVLGIKNYKKRLLNGLNKKIIESSKKPVIEVKMLNKYTFLACLVYIMHDSEYYWYIVIGIIGIILVYTKKPDNQVKNILQPKCKWCNKIKKGNIQESEGVLLSNDFGIGLGLWILGGGLGIIGLGGLFFWYKGVQEKRRICKILEETGNPRLRAKEDTWYNTLILEDLCKPEGLLNNPNPVQEDIALFTEYLGYLQGLMSEKNLTMTIIELYSDESTEIFNKKSLLEFIQRTEPYINALNNQSKKQQQLEISRPGFDWNTHKTITPLVLMPVRLPWGQKQKVLKLLEKNLKGGKSGFLHTFFQYAPGEQITLCRAATNEVLKNLYKNYWIAPIQKKYRYFNLDNFMGHCVKKYHKLYFDKYYANDLIRKKFFDELHKSADLDQGTKTLYETLGYRFVLYASFLEQKKLAEDLKYPYETVMNIFPGGHQSIEFQNEVTRYIEEVDGPRTKAEILRIKADFFENHPNKKLFVTEAVISPDSFSNIPKETFKHIAVTYGKKELFVYPSSPLRQKLNDFASNRFERTLAVYYQPRLLEINVTTRVSCVPIFDKSMPRVEAATYELAERPNQETTLFLNHLKRNSNRTLQEICELLSDSGYY